MALVVEVLIVASVSLMPMLMMPLTGVPILEEGDPKVDQVGQGLLQLPRCRRGQELGNTGEKGVSRREGEAGWIPSL